MNILTITPVSRANYLKAFIDRLKELEIDEGDNLEHLFLVDGDQKLIDKVHTLTNDIKAQKFIIWSKNKNVPNGIQERRQRIANIHTTIKNYIFKNRHLIKATHVLLLEDDTIVPINAIRRLKSLWWENNNKYQDKVGFVSGIALGRHGFAHIGAWRVDNLKYLQKIESIQIEDRIMEVTATGLYCLLTKIDLYLMDFQPFEEVLGPDFTFGLKLSLMGYRNYVDTMVRCEHMTPKGALDFENTDTLKIHFKKLEGKWVLNG